nr:sialokinin II=vasodilatory tachykinin [Aedes aegypti=yellow fever mosquitoes, Rockefeller, salivary glands, Peptide, 10 aa] [Aedes aegypti]
DTGDKFYGLM